MTTLTKDILADLVRNKTLCSSRQAKNLLEVLLEEIKAPLTKGEEIKISGFGKWVVKEKKRRPGRNPHTGKKIEITARKVVVFHPSEKFRHTVNSHNLELKKESSDELFSLEV